MKLTDKQKEKVHRAALREVANVLDNDWGDPFKDRELPELPEDAYEAADKHFFVCIASIAKEMRMRSRLK